MTSVPPGTSTTASPDIVQFLENLNTAWLTCDYAALERFYHAGVVLLPPDAGAPLLGRDAVIATYRDFHSVCSVVRFNMTDTSSWRFEANSQMPSTPDLTPDLATTVTTTMVHMRFEIDYRFTNSAQVPDSAATSTPSPIQAEQGMDIYTLQHSAQDPHPVIIWRAQFTL